MKLTTLPIASEPYSADAPSVSTSTRSIAASGSVFRFTAAEKPVNVCEPAGATRRPLSSTSVRISPWLRRLAPVKPPPPPPTESPSAVKPCITGSAWISSCTEVAPVRSMSSRLITCTGSAPSLWMRLIAEPVISMRCAGASCASAGSAAASRQASVVLL
jgi:hypothetical protein